MAGKAAAKADLSREGKEWVEKEDNYILRKTREGIEVKDYCVAMKRKQTSIKERLIELLTVKAEEMSRDDIAEEMNMDREALDLLIGPEEEAEAEAEAEAEGAPSGLPEPEEGEEVEADGEAQEEEAEVEPAPKPAAAAGSARVKVEEKAKPAATPPATPVKEAVPKTPAAKITEATPILSPNVVPETDIKLMLAIQTEIRDLLKQFVTLAHTNAPSK